MPTGDSSAPSRGCYGLRLVCLTGAARYLADVPLDAPSLVVRATVEEPPTTLPSITADRAVLSLSDGGSVAVLERSAGVVNLSLRQPYADEALLHPLLSGSLAVTNWWHGRDAFHAGAMVIGERAWAVLGDKGQGKSSTLAHLALRGVPVLSDDIVVVDENDVLAGPAFIDLRPDAAAHLGAGRNLGWLGARERFRLDIPPPPGRVPLAGWLHLRWGEEVALRPVPVRERLPRLFANRAVLLQPAAPAAFVRHAALPFFDLQRPKDWSLLPMLHHLLATSLGG